MGTFKFRLDARKRAEGFLLELRKRLVLLFVVCAGLGFLLVITGALAPDHGLRGRFYPNASFGGDPASVSLDSVISFDKLTLAARAGDVEELSAAWEGFAFAPKSSVYRFSVRAEGAVRVSVGGRLVLDVEDGSPEQQIEEEISLPRGSHALLIRYNNVGDGALIDFSWKEVRTPKSLMPRLHLYPRPVSMATFVLDTALAAVRPLLRFAWLAAAALLLLAGARATFHSLRTESVLALSLFCALAALYATELFSKRATAVWGCDTYAYLHGAELMAEKGLFRTDFVDPLIPAVHRGFRIKPSDHQFIFLMSPHGYYVYDREEGAVYNLFPPGVSLFLYPFVKLMGRGAAFFVMPLLNLILLTLFFVLGTRAVDAVFGLCLTAFTFFNFHVFENSALIMSDLPSMGLMAAAAFLLYRNIKKPRLILPALAGACFGLSLVFRYSNLAGIIPLAWIYWTGYRERRRPGVFPREAAAFSLSAFALGALPLAIYTYRLFGTPFRLVYEPISQSRFQAGNLGPGLAYYLSSLWRTFGPVSLGAAAVGLAALLLNSRRRAIAVACLLAFLAFFGFHVFHSIQNERYLLPAYPFLGLLFAFGVLEVVRWTRRSFTAVLLVVALCGAIPFVRSQPAYRRAETQAEDWAAALAKKIEPGGVVFCDELSGSMRLYQGIPGYRFVPTDGSTLLEAADIMTALGRPVYLYVDNALAEEPFRLLLERAPLLARRLEPAAVVRGRFLFRVGPRHYK